MSANHSQGLTPPQSVVTTLNPFSLDKTESLLGEFQRLRTLKDVRLMAQLNLRQMSAYLNSRTQTHYNPSALANFERGRARYYVRRNGTRGLKYPVPEFVFGLYQQALNETLERLTGEHIRVRLKGTKTGRIKVQPLRHCPRCSREFVLANPEQVACPHCTRAMHKCGLVD